MADLSAYRFTASHEWVEITGGTARVGITDHAQAQLGDVIFVELPEVGRELKVGERFGVIESVKAASDLYAPLGGRVAAVNERLADTPETINGDPYGEGWMLKLENLDEAGSDLLDEQAYQQLAEG